MPSSRSGHVREVDVVGRPAIVRVDVKDATKHAANTAQSSTPSNNNGCCFTLAHVRYAAYASVALLILCFLFFDENHDVDYFIAQSPTNEQVNNELKYIQLNAQKQQIQQIQQQQQTQAIQQPQPTISTPVSTPTSTVSDSAAAVIVPVVAPSTSPAATLSLSSVDLLSSTVSSCFPFCSSGWFRHLYSSPILYGVLNFDVWRAKMIASSWGAFIHPNDLLILSDGVDEKMPSLVTMKPPFPNRPVSDRRGSAWKILPAMRVMYNHNPNKLWYYICDDDSYPLIHNLHELITHYDATKDWYLGEPTSQSTFMRAYYKDEKDTGRKIKLTYICTGGGVLMTNSLMKKLIGVIDDCPVFFASDVSLGYCIKEKLKVSATAIKTVHHAFARTPEEYAAAYDDNMLSQAAAYHHMRNPYIDNFGVSESNEQYVRSTAIRFYPAYYYTISRILTAQAKRISHDTRLLKAPIKASYKLVISKPIRIAVVQSNVHAAALLGGRPISSLGSVPVSQLLQSHLSAQTAPAWNGPYALFTNFNWHTDLVVLAPATTAAQTACASPCSSACAWNEAKAHVFPGSAEAEAVSALVSAFDWSRYDLVLLYDNIVPSSTLSSPKFARTYFASVSALCAKSSSATVAQLDSDLLSIFIWHLVFSAFHSFLHLLLMCVFVEYVATATGLTLSVNAVPSKSAYSLPTEFFPHSFVFYGVFHLLLGSDIYAARTHVYISDAHKMRLPGSIESQLLHSSTMPLSITTMRSLQSFLQAKICLFLDGLTEAAPVAAVNSPSLPTAEEYINAVASGCIIIGAAHAHQTVPWLFESLADDKANKLVNKQIESWTQLEQHLQDLTQPIQGRPLHLLAGIQRMRLNALLFDLPVHSLLSKLQIFSQKS